MKNNSEFINISFEKRENINSSIGFKFAKLFRLFTISMYSRNETIPEFYLIDLLDGPVHIIYFS